jgi:hypothetical protein
MSATGRGPRIPARPRRPQVPGPVRIPPRPVDDLDPRRDVGRLSDELPLLLFPLRIETRFKQVPVRGRLLRHELWVRVFPDSCLVDTFEPEPSRGEIEDVRR